MSVPAQSRPAADLERLDRFMAVVSATHNGEEPLRQRLQRVASALDDLVVAEIRYYHRSRRRHALISAVCRVGAWITGTVGLLLPLVGAALPQYGALTSWGYVFLGGSAAALAANSLFGGSATHARNTSAQLELERLLLRFRLQWLRIDTSAQPDDDVVAAAFALFDQLAEDAAGVVAAETTQWSSALQRAIDSYGVAGGAAGRR